MESVRLLFLADTHLGFDMPLSPRIDRKRRGPDFFKGYLKALAPALQGEVDLVVHGGDLFFRSRVHQAIISKAFAPLIEIADRGIPVFLVPGNHERSFLPRSLFETHPGIHIFSQPKTYSLSVRGVKLALSGFPCLRNGIRNRFPQLLRETRWQDHQADIHLLCMHQTVEGAVAGIQNYLFRSGVDIIPANMIPPVTAVLSGHIHTRQILRHDLAGIPMAAPVYYGGSTERCSFVERVEPKGYWNFSFQDGKGFIAHDIVDYQELETRPMILLEFDPDDLQFEKDLKKLLAQLPDDAVVRIKLTRMPEKKHAFIPTAKVLRSMAPLTMTIDLTVPRQRTV